MLSKLEQSSSKSCEFSAVVHADNISGGCGTLLALESIEILRNWWASSTEFIILYYSIAIEEKGVMMMMVLNL